MKELQELYDLIKDDGRVIQFQTIGQYREMLMVRINQMMKDLGGKSKLPFESEFISDLKKHLDETPIEVLQKEWDEVVALGVGEASPTKENEFKKITGWDTEEEMAAYEKGREDEQTVMTNFVNKWDGNTRSHMGQALFNKFNELKENKDI